MSPKREVVSPHGPTRSISPSDGRGWAPSRPPSSLPNHDLRPMPLGSSATLSPSGPSTGSVDLPPPPISLDPREPPASPSPRPSTRTPSRVTPVHSRTASPQPRGGPNLANSLSSLASGSGSIPSSPISGGAHSMHSREEDSMSAIFERDIEPIGLPLAGGSAAAASAAAALSGVGGQPPHSPIAHHHLQHHHHHLQSASPDRGSGASPTLSSHVHHPQARGSATDHLFPTVLDDAVEALSSGEQDVFVVTPSRTGSPSALSSRRTVSADMREGSPTSAGARSPVLSLTGYAKENERERERRTSSASLTGQAGRILGAFECLPSSDASSSAPQSFRLTLPGGPEPISTPSNFSPPSTSSSPPVSISPPPPSPLTTTISTSSSLHQHQHLPTIPNPHSHKLSFISPQDLIASSPVSTHSLAAFTSGAAAAAGPGTGVGGAGSSNVSVPQSPGLPGGGGGGGGGGDDGGGGGGVAEWEREGLGKGLEERLEDLLLKDRDKEKESMVTSSFAAAAV